MEKQVPRTLRSLELAHTGSRSQRATSWLGHPAGAPVGSCFGQAPDQVLGAGVDETEVGSGPLVLHRRVGAGKKCWGTGGAETGGLASSSKGL